LRYEKRHEKCVLFLEDGFGTTTYPERLRAAGYEVECFATHFQKDGKREDGVKDSRIIKFCQENDFVLVTSDKNIRYTHVDIIKGTEVAIIATESNQSSMALWVEALKLAKPKIERTVRKHRRPWFARLSRTGDIRKVETITQSMSTRRRRPRE
jgi:predicted nuclease of predicted toxin-antitoxin system